MRFSPNQLELRKQSQNTLWSASHSQEQKKSMLTIHILVASIAFLFIKIAKLCVVAECSNTCFANVRMPLWPRKLKVVYICENEAREWVIYSSICGAHFILDNIHGCNNGRGASAKHCFSEWMLSLPTTWLIKYHKQPEAPAGTEHFSHILLCYIMNFKWCRPVKMFRPVILCHWPTHNTPSFQSGIMLLEMFTK